MFLAEAPHIFIIPRVSAWVLEFQVCLEGIPHGEAAAAEVEILMRWVFTSSKRKPQFLNPLLDLKSSSIGDSVHRPYDFGTFLFPEPPTEENALLDNLLLKSTWEQTLQGRERPRVRLKLTLKMGRVKNMNDLKNIYWVLRTFVARISLKYVGKSFEKRMWANLDKRTCV